MRFASVPFLASVTPSGGGGSAAAYIDETFALGTDTIVGVLPTGVTSSDTLCALVFNHTGSTNALETMPAPSGWTALTGVTAQDLGGRLFTAPGNVGTLTFSASGLRGLVLFGVTAPLRAHAFEAIDFSTPGQGANTPCPTVSGVVAADCAVSVYIQLDDGTGGALAAPGSPQAGYTRQFLANTDVPRVSILSQEGLAAGSTGTVAHDGNGNFATRHLFTGVFGA